MILRLAWKNLLHKRLSTALAWTLLSISVATISLLLMVKKQLEEQFDRNIQNVDMVIGAKGSPLQLILSAIFHIDTPTGNIKMEDAEKWMKHPFVGQAIPLAYGDSYKGHPVVGTTPAYISNFHLSLAQGRFYQHDFELVIGSTAAKKLNLAIGSQVCSTHGADGHGDQHTAHPYTVTGILQPAGSVSDNLLLCNIASIWKIHDHGHDEHHKKEEKQEDHEEHEQELTAVLIKFRNPMGQVQLPRLINEQTNLMAAVPAIEMNRLYTLFGAGFRLLTMIGIAILLLSAFSVFVSLYNSLKERRYELALMRTMGGSRGALVMLPVLESLMLSLAGFITGILLSRAGLMIIAATVQQDYYLSLDAWTLLFPEELYLLGLVILLALASSLLPAISAWSLNISKTLSHE